MITIRRATDADTPPMAEILNALIAEGSTTALAKPVTANDLLQKMQAGGAKAAWHVAETEDGEVVGFQWLAPYPTLPPEAGDIATFAKMGKTGLGIGTKLFTATKQAAQDLGYDWINANIRSDNTSGLRYYHSLGFVDYDSVPNVQLDDGRIITKTLKRFDLKEV
ncbi:MAG: GNAT family N-acetyltransferase [Pseudomonadota bacterium]